MACTHNILDVQQNISSLSKQIQGLEIKHENATISRPDVRNEERLPITEIYEELDEDGNVICKSAKRYPGGSQS